MNSSSEEPGSSEEPTSSQETPTDFTTLKPVTNLVIDNIIGVGDSNKILWINNSGWYTLDPTIRLS